ncbi:MAG: hypothetical protein EA394_06145 [Bacteroidia bacterium]|nr:MAG: hypothetical protein EA394_06145 [Bacteroidia bacterium]
MKRTFVAIILAAGFGAASMASTFSGYTVLTFETADGKNIRMEMPLEAEATVNTPVLFTPAPSHNYTDPNNHTYLQSLILELLKPEKEEPTPFDNE